jgi:hypothetical protein
MRRLLIVICSLESLISAAGSALAAASTDYDRDLISVATIGRHSAFPTANCMVWANAEGLGVGPAQLDGFHGLTMNINLKPLANEAAVKPTTFETGFADMKARFPTAPAWLVATVEKNRAAIEKACSEDHETPFKVYTITSRDAHG